MKPVRIRKFLNLEGNYELASVLVDVDNNGIAFKLTDCTHHVSLHFETYSKKDRNNVLYKVDTLEQAVRQLRRAAYQYCREQDRKKGGDE